MQIPYFCKTIKVYELDKNSISTQIFQKLFNDIKIVAEKKNIKYPVLNQNPAIILIPISAFDYLLADFPDIDDEEELNEWVQEYYSHNASQSIKDYKFNYLHLNQESNDHKILIISILKAEYQKYLESCSEIENPIYFGSGIESLGLTFGLNDDLQNKKNVIITASGERTIVLEYANSSLSAFHEFETVDIDNIAQQDENTIIWNLKESDDQEKKILLSGKEISLQDFRKTGVLLNHFYKIAEPLNLLDSNKIDNSKGNVEKSSALKLSSILFAAMLLLLVIPLIAGSINTVSINKLDANLALIKDKLSLIEKQQKDISHLKKQLQQKADITQTSSHFNGYLELIGRNIPADLQLDKLQITVNNKDFAITINGNAAVKTPIASLLSNLEQEEYFKNVELSFIEVQEESQPNTKNNNRRNKNNVTITKKHFFEIKVSLK
jgi:Tfp pilus assembly protein PilN